MRGLVVSVAVLTAVASGVESAAAGQPHGPPFAFGGNGPHGAYVVRIHGDGSVHASGDGGLTRAATQVTSSELVSLDRRAVRAHFGSLPSYTRCNGAARNTTTWIEVGSKKVTVAGTCLDAYQQLWKAFVASTHFFMSG
jgi:hypothetical protein